jgi:hypothetical protein
MKTIELTQGQIALIDDNMYDRLSYFSWYALKVKRKLRVAYYVRTNFKINGILTSLSMHQLIMGMPSNTEIDHADGNGLNNQISNLRLCTHIQNSRNRRKLPNLTSKYKGVSFHSQTNRWVSHIRINKKLVHLGYFKSEKNAAIAYNNAAIKHFDKFIIQNNI